MDKYYGNVSHFYSQIYNQLIGEASTGVLKILSAFPHLYIERKFKTNKSKQILEVGCGSGEHMKYVKNDFDEYVALDIDEPRVNELSSAGIANVRAVVGNAERLEFPDASFDRVIATCILAHLKNPEIALEEWRRVLKEEGNLSIYVPCEPGIALRIFRVVTTLRRSRKLGFNGYDLCNVRDHINSAANLTRLIRHVFRDDSCHARFKPLPISSWYFNLFIIFEIRKSTK